MVQRAQAFDMEFLSGPDREELPKQAKLRNVWSHECLALPAEALWPAADGPLADTGAAAT